MKWIDDDAVASARFEPDTKIAGKIRERMMNCGGERRGPRSLRTLPKDRQRGFWHAGFLYESKHAPRPRSAGGCHRPVWSRRVMNSWRTDCHSLMRTAARAATRSARPGLLVGASGTARRAAHRSAPPHRRG